MILLVMERFKNRQNGMLQKGLIMPNKLYSDVNNDYLVEGSKDKGYLKNSGKGYGDGKPSGLVTDYTTNTKGTTISKEDNWFEGKKSGVGTSVKR